jgi:homoserine dehydrogenase
MTRASLRIGVLGAGTVGREVVRLLLDDRDRLATGGGCTLTLVGVAVRNIEAAARRGIPAGLLTDAPADLVASTDTDAIVELMGGAEPAQTLIAAALSAGKPVVTANKQVIAHRGPELERLSRRTGAALRFEAAVGGGIPVLGPLAADLAGNEVRRVRGIVNGTTNFILSGMADGRGTYDEVLTIAQEEGYAEADPSSDVEGRDAVNKLVILARLAFGQWLGPSTISDRPPSGSGGRGKPGITGVTAAEIAAAAALGLRLRLLATAIADESGVVEAAVVPTAVPADSPLGQTGGVRNRIEVRARPVGDVGFDGPGAGGEATASAVLGDLLTIARGQGSTWAGLPAAETSRGRDLLTTGERAWFALLPRGRRADIDANGRHPAAIEITELPAGLAVRTPPLTLAAVRTRLTGADTIYPIDD